jgi:hypothetical protein
MKVTITAIKLIGITRPSTLTVFANGYVCAILRMDSLSLDRLRSTNWQTLLENSTRQLAAAVRAWNEVTADTGALNGKTPKKALEIWLRKHANEYGLTNKDGNPNELGIEEICKVANWKPAGGASPTSVATLTPPPEEKSSWTRRVRPNPPTRRANRPALLATTTPPDIDDDIPF